MVKHSFSVFDLFVGLALIDTKLKLTLKNHQCLWNYWDSRSIDPVLLFGTFWYQIQSPPFASSWSLLTGILYTNCFTILNPSQNVRFITTQLALGMICTHLKIAGFRNGVKLTFSSAIPLDKWWEFVISPVWLHN